MSSDTIMFYVEAERLRCLGLTRKIKDRDFLAWCIEHSVQPKQVSDFRRRYEEMKDAEITDLLG